MSRISKQEMLIQNILEHVGGKHNVKDVYHCATRMRLTLNNEDLVQIAKIKTINNLKGALWSNGELQIIIGPEVSQVTSLLKKELANHDISQQTEDLKLEKSLKLKDSNLPMWRKFLKSVSAIFGPLIPFLIGVGLIMALQQLLIRIGVAHTVDYNDLTSVNTFDIILDVIASSGFKLMGVVAMWSTVRYLGGKTPIALALALFMVSPIIPSDGVLLGAIGSWEITIKPFYSTILIFIVMGIIVAIAQKEMEKRFNPVANFILNPFLTLFVGGMLAFFVFGPVMAVIEEAMLSVFNWFMTIPFGIGTLIVGLTWQPLVVLGVHNILFFAATTDLIATGHPSLFLAAAFAAAWAQMGATIGVAIRSKRSVDRSSAIAAALPGIISGPTESCIYAVNLPRWVPFITGTLAGAIGGWLIGMFNVGLNNLAGLGGIVGFLAYTDKLAAAIIIDLFSFALGIGITMLFWRETKTEKMLVKATTKLLNRAQHLSTKHDYRAQQLIVLIKQHHKKKTNKIENMQKIIHLSQQIATIEPSIKQLLDDLLTSLKAGEKNAKLTHQVLKKLKLITSQEQTQLNHLYVEINQYVKNNKDLVIAAKAYEKTINDVKNHEFKLSRINDQLEEKQAKFFTKTQKLLHSSNESKKERGEAMASKGINLNTLETRLKKLQTQLKVAESNSESKYIVIKDVTHQYYESLETFVTNIEKITNNNLHLFKDYYYNDVHRLEIAQQKLTPKNLI